MKKIIISLGILLFTLLSIVFREGIAAISMVLIATVLNVVLGLILHREEKRKRV